MKKLFYVLFIFILLVAPFSFIFAASAEPISGKYIEINTNLVYLTHTTNSIESEFELPNSFYAKYLNLFTSLGYYEVEYNSIRGFMPTKVGENTFSPTLKENLTSPYFDYNTTAQGKKTPLKTNSEATLYAGPKQNTAVVANIATGAALYFIGLNNKVEQTEQINGNSCWYFVKVNTDSSSKYGYLPSSKTTATQLTHNDDIKRLVVETNTDNDGGTSGGSLSPGKNTEPENNLLRVLLIIGITVPAIIIVVMLFKPVKSKSNSYTWDRNVYSNKNNEDEDIDRRY